MAAKPVSALVNVGSGAGGFADAASPFGPVSEVKEKPPPGGGTPPPPPPPPSPPKPPTPKGPLNPGPVISHSSGRNVFKGFLETPYGWTKATVRLWTELDFAGALDVAKIGLSRSGVGVSIHDGPLTVSDPRFYQFGASFAPDAVAAGRGVQRTVDPHYNVDVEILGTDISTPIGPVRVTTSFDPLTQTVTVGLSAELKSPARRLISIAYGATIEIVPLPKPPTIRLPPEEWLVMLAALAAEAYAVYFLIRSNPAFP
jgi:hypothetical protein